MTSAFDLLQLGDINFPDCHQEGGIPWNDAGGGANVFPDRAIQRGSRDFRGSAATKLRLAALLAGLPISEPPG